VVGTVAGICWVLLRGRKQFVSACCGYRYLAELSLFAIKELVYAAALVMASGAGWLMVMVPSASQRYYH
jgi:hypothetical protein